MTTLMFVRLLLAVEISLSVFAAALVGVKVFGTKQLKKSVEEKAHSFLSLIRIKAH